MAISGIDVEGLNSAAAGAGKGLEEGATGALSFTESATSLLGVITDLGNTLDYVTRNPLLSFTFFERIGRSLQKDIISNLKLVKNATDEQVNSWNKWGTAINFTNSMVMTFASRIASLQIQLRQYSIEASKYFNTTSMPFGTGYQTAYELNKNQALQTLKLNSDFAKANTEVIQSMGRMITPGLIRQQLPGKNTEQIQNAYRNYLERFTLYSRQFPEANIPEAAKQIYGATGGYGMTTFGAAGAAMRFAQRANTGLYAPTATPGQNITAIMSLYEQYKNSGMSPETAFQAAQTSLLTLGQQRGKAGETLPLNRMLELSKMYPGMAEPEKRIVSRALGVDMKQFEGPEGPSNFAVALQRWSKKQGLGERPQSEVQALVTGALGQKMGQSYETLMSIANMPNFSVNIKEIRNLVDSFGELNSTELEMVRKGILDFSDIPDEMAKKFRINEVKSKGLPDIISGLWNTAVNAISKSPDQGGIPPWVLQTLILGGVGGVGAFKIYGALNKLKNIALPSLMGGRVATTAGLTIGASEGMYGAGYASSIAGASTATTSATVGKLSKLSGFLKSPALKTGGAIVAATLLTDLLAGRTKGGEMSSDIIESFLSYGAFKANPTLAMFGMPTELGGGPTSSERLNMEIADYQKKSKSGAVSFRPEYVESLEKRYRTQLKKEGKLGDEGKDTSTVHIIVSGAQGEDLGEAMIQKGQEAYINITTGAVIHGLRG